MKEMIDLIQKAQGGDFKSLCAIIEELRSRIQSLANYYAKCGDQDPEDLFQEAWLGVLEALKEVDISIGEPQQYIIKRAKWRMLNFSKWNKRRQHESLEEIDLACCPTVQEESEKLNQLEQSIAGVHLSQFFKRLNQKQRALVGLLLAGNTWREAASKLDCTSANVAYHVRQIQKVYLQWISSG